MQIILQQINRARRRWITALGFQFLAYSCCATFSLAIVCLLVPKVVVVPMATERGEWIVIAVAGALGALFAFGMTWMYRPSVDKAAIEVDLRLNLKERLSSALALHGSPETGLSQALVADAARAAERIDVRDAFPLLLTRRTWLYFLPVLLSGAIFWIPNSTATGSLAGNSSTSTQSDIENAIKPLAAMVQQAKQEAEENGLEDSADFYKKLEKQIDDLKRPISQDNKKLLTDLNALKQELEKRREELGTSEGLKKNLAAMKEFTEGPADAMANAMKEGDFEKASESIEKLMNDLDKGDLSASDIDLLSKQLESMAQAMEKAVAEHAQAKQDLENKIAQAEQAGDMQRAAELRKELGEKKAEDAQISELAEMASKMKDAKANLEKGDQKSAQKAMQAMRSQMDKMSRNSAQSKALGKMLKEAKDAKAKASSGKMGADMDAEGGKGKGRKDGAPKWRRGGGEGAGGGPRDEEESETRQIDSQVRTDIEEGESIYGGKVGGANRKGATREEVQQSILASEIEDEQAIESIVLPKRQRDQTRDYFDSLRK